LAKAARFSNEIFFQEGYAEAISPPRENLLSKPVIGAGGWDRNDPAAEPGASAIGKVLVSSIIALCSRSVPVPIAEGDSPGGNVARDYAPCTDQGIVADAHTRKDDSAAADPDIASDPDGTTELQTGGPLCRIARMSRGEDLHRRPDLCLFADADRDNVENHAVEIEEDSRTETDVEAVVAMKRRPDHRILTDGGEAFRQKSSAFGVGSCECCIVAHQPSMRHRPFGFEFRVAGVVEIAGQHLLLFAAYSRSAGHHPSA
jgi:hypothetical protein